MCEKDWVCSLKEEQTCTTTILLTTEAGHSFLGHARVFRKVNE